MNPLERLERHDELVTAARRTVMELRAAAVRDLVAGEWTYRSLAARFGVSAARVHQWGHYRSEER